MAEPEEWRPGSFTKNFSWGDQSQGLKELHESIRVGFNGTMEDVARGIFRRRVNDSGRIDFIPMNFFLYNKFKDGKQVIVADELVYQALNFDHSPDFDKLALFAFNFSYVGTWQGAEPYQSRPALWAHHYISDRIAQEENWNIKKISADDIERFLRSDKRYVAKTTRKLATNLNYLYQIAHLSELSNSRVERWWVNAIFLALDRLIEDRLRRNIATTPNQFAARLDRANFHFISGRRSIEKDLATKHLLKLYDACGGRSRFSDEEVRARQELLLPDLHWFANQIEPIAALHPSNPRIVKTLPRACAMLARYCAGFIDLDLDQLENMDLQEFIRGRTKEALDKLRQLGVSPTMTAEELMKITRGR